jgi:hypothetical protein
MPEAPKPPEWKHNQEVSFKGVRELLTVVKDRLDDMLKEKKAELQRMVGARDSLRK